MLPEDGKAASVGSAGMSEGVVGKEVKETAGARHEGKLIPALPSASISQNSSSGLRV